MKYEKIKCSSPPAEISGSKTKLKSIRELLLLGLLF